MGPTLCQSRNMARGEPTKTIGNARAAGETRFTVHCGRIECGHRAELAFDEIRLPDETIFVHIPRLLNFVCSKCGEGYGDLTRQAGTISRPLGD
jgi:hypothetical protein